MPKLLQLDDDAFGNSTTSNHVSPSAPLLLPRVVPQIVTPVSVVSSSSLQRQTWIVDQLQSSIHSATLARTLGSLYPSALTTLTGRLGMSTFTIDGGRVVAVRLVYLSMKRVCMGRVFS